MTGLIPLPELGAALMERYGAPSPGYQHVHRMISKGLLTPERMGGRSSASVSSVGSMCLFP